PEKEAVPENPILPPPTNWATLYIAAGKKEKINKVDIAGLLLKKGQLAKEDLGLIEVLDSSAYAAVNRDQIERVVQLVRNEKIKGKKIKIEISRERHCIHTMSNNDIMKKVRVALKFTDDDIIEVWARADFRV